MLDGLRTLTRPRSQPTGDTRSRLLSPTTPASSSTQVTLGAPTPPPTGPYRVCTGPRVRQGRTSSLRCGRSTLTNTSGPEPSAHRGPCRPDLTQVTPAVRRSRFAERPPPRALFLARSGRASWDARVVTGRARAVCRDIDARSATGPRPRPGDRSLDRKRSRRFRLGRLVQVLGPSALPARCGARSCSGQSGPRPPATRGDLAGFPCSSPSTLATDARRCRRGGLCRGPGRWGRRRRGVARGVAVQCR
jgi:hypothetical protein